MDFCYILVIELIPLAVDDVLRVGYVVSTWVGSRIRESDFWHNKTSQRLPAARHEAKSYFLQCRGGK